MISYVNKWGLPLIWIANYYFVIILNQKFDSSQNIWLRKPLKDANSLPVYVYVYIVCVCKWYVYKPAEVDVPKLSQDHMGSVRPKINDLEIVYWQLNV
jgi:hypothetical protein